MRGSLMRLWTKDQHVDILTRFKDDTEAAAHYSTGLKSRVVQRQNVTYWRHIFIVNDGNMPKTDNQLKNDRRLREPQPDDDVGKLPNLDKVYNCILAIPDQHHPYEHPDMLTFLGAVKKSFPIDLVVNMGDETDYHGLSFHDSDPNLDSAGVELEKAKKALAFLHDLFPNQLVCNSNHGSMAFRKAKHHGIPVQLLKKYREVLFPTHKAPGWSWADEWIIKTPLGPVMFRHSSSNPTADAAHERCNLMVGHNHSKFAIEYCASKDYLYWGATIGCLINSASYAFAYGKTFTKKPIIGCAVILEGKPMLIPMVLNAAGRWIGHL
jgi:hypothetical protein